MVNGSEVTGLASLKGSKKQSTVWNS